MELFSLAADAIGSAEECQTGHAPEISAARRAALVFPARKQAGASQSIPGLI
jgi:hypothetical protein